ncbi:hypothetical protein DFJ73DRAFT_880325 [Zopfochytrium polystomum]|nr:hypothetical protein DFJ73DRAFT_880325 [Zopfochytrium polystomum]
MDKKPAGATPKKMAGAATLTTAVVATDLPAGTSKDAISETFSEHGQVIKVLRILKNNETEAVVTFSTEEESKAAIAAGSITVDGKKVSVRAPKQKAVGEPSNVLVVGNLPVNVTPGPLKKLFAAFGTVTNVTVPRAKESKGKWISKGYGGVEFSTVFEATTALKALNGSVFNGRTISIRYLKK